MFVLTARLPPPSPTETGLISRPRRQKLAPAVSLVRAAESSALYVHFEGVGDGNIFALQSLRPQHIVRQHAECVACVEFECDT